MIGREACCECGAAAAASGSPATREAEAERDMACPPPSPPLEDEVEQLPIPPPLGRAAGGVESEAAEKSGCGVPLLCCGVCGLLDTPPTRLWPPMCPPLLGVCCTASRPTSRSPYASRTTT